jgi:hypothetical protein
MGQVRMTRLGILQPLLVPPLALAAMVVGVPSTPRAEVSSPVLHADETPVRSRTLGLGGALTQGTTQLRSSRPLDLAGAEQVALTWAAGQRAPVAEVRTLSGTHWSAWTAVEPLEDGDASEGNGTAGSDLLWVGHRDKVQVRVRGAAPRGLAAVVIDPGQRDADTDPAAAGGPGPGSPVSADVQPSAPFRLAATATTSEYRDTTLDAPPHTTFPSPRVPRPTIYSRRAWGADESLRRNPPEWSVTISQVHLHHTASTNSYTRADVPAMIRGMYSYHVRTLGWNDIGYNFLVDKYGRTWEGRAGGVHTAVAWPYANGPRHIGHVAGFGVPSDVFSRYMRMAGHDVLMVSAPTSTARRSWSRPTRRA